MSVILTASERLRFEDLVRQFGEGELTQEEFRNIRVPMGIYEQRGGGRYMMRVRIPAGRLTARQLMALADAADLYGNALIHLTTRQDAQIHNLSIQSIVPALRLLLPFGLVSKGCGGNTVRNITACPACDLFGDSILDVAPLVRRLTQKLLADSESYRLPRKLKIAVSACPDDCAETAFADIGFMARRLNSVNGNVVGFQVLAGGGLGAKSARALEIESYVSPDEIYLVVAAIRKLWMEKGNYRDKHHARLRFLLQDLGEAEFLRRYLAEKEKLREWMSWPIVPMPEPYQPLGEPSAIPQSADRAFLHWKKSCVSHQARSGYYAVTVPALLGDISSESAGTLGEFLWNEGLNELRLTQQQNFVIPNVPGGKVPPIYEFLKRIGAAPSIPRTLIGMSICNGAGNCQVGVCRSKDAAREILKRSDRSYWSHPAFRNLTIRVGGCHNNCARPSAAVLGFIGVARSHAGLPFPAYQVLWGGKVRGARSALAEVCGVVPARWLANFLDNFLGRLAGILSKDASADDLIRVGRPILRACLGEFQQAPPYEVAPLFYRDLAADNIPFTTAGRGEAECASG